jgi:hypothetical protein
VSIPGARALEQGQSDDGDDGWWNWISADCGPAGLGLRP